MARNVRFRPGLRETLTSNAVYLAAMSSDGLLPADLQRSLDAAMPAPKKVRAAPRHLEQPVVAAISHLLSVHPLVLFAVRQNTGMASYESKGRWAPVHFYRKLTHGAEVTIPDFWGILRDGRFLAIEAKRPGWLTPSSSTELAQANFLTMVANVGGVSLFATDASQVAAALR